MDYKIDNFKGLKAIWSGHTGIVDWGVVTKSYGKDFEEAGGKIYYNHPLRGIKLVSENPAEGKENKYPVKVTSDAGKVRQTNEGATTQ